MAGVMKFRCPVCKSKVVAYKVDPGKSPGVERTVYLYCTNFDCRMQYTLDLRDLRITKPSDLPQTEAITAPEVNHSGN